MAAGTIDWPQAWVLLDLCIGCGLATGQWLKRWHPGLYAERTKSPTRYELKKVSMAPDRVLVEQGPDGAENTFFSCLTEFDAMVVNLQPLEAQQ